MLADPTQIEPRFRWLLASEEPWTRYRTLVDLLGRSDAKVAHERAEMLAHPADNAHGAGRCAGTLYSQLDVPRLERMVIRR